ncbi:hypothetical protein C7M84_007582 [Penaeus vannamei]|uniref:RNA-directed DNA polymerase n=1 Tax=Penaeus vannamei TaxID=6689 RepID=A0A423TBT8_PENVA|nr:hypothetical protein C7M84_007582 [Penaeus vannamei]
MGRRNGGSRNNSPSRPSTSQEAASAPSVGRNSPSGQTLLPDSDDRGIERLPEISVMEELFQKISQLTLEVQNLRFQNSELEARISRPSSPVSVREAPPVEFVVQRDPIPQFKAEVSSAHPLKRNQEVESWLRSVENHTRPQTDAAFIKAAKASCKGAAELIVNSPLFDSIVSWVEFKDKLRQKFRGTGTSSDFYRVLHSQKLQAGQAPMDFYLILEGMVYQGLRDYPRAIGDPDDLIRRVFLQGLPRWIREAVVVKEEAELCNLVETTQRVWSLRESEGPGVSSPTRSPFRPRVLAAAEVDPPRKYCRYHKNHEHDSSECRVLSERRKCFACGEQGHFARQCPFVSRQVGVAATPSLASKEVLSTTDCDNEVLQKPAGRPMVSLMVNGFKTQCFVDTGSEVAHVAVPAFVPPRSGRFVKCSVPRGMQAAKELMVSGIECPLVVPRSLQEYAAEEQALGTELFMGNDNDFELGEGFIDDDFDSFDAVGDFGGADDYILLPDVDLPPCSVVTQTPVGVDQSGSSTDCPEDVQLKDAELGDLLSEIDLGHLTLEQQQQLRQLSRAVAATELHNRDPDDLRRHQLEDPLWKEVIEYLEERNLPRRRLPLTLEEFELRDGVLYHVRHLPDRVLHQLVVPKTLRGSAMHLAHSSATAGHPGVYRTYCKLRDYFYFPNMLAAVKEYVGTCRSCQKRKGMAYRAPLAAAPQASYPLERVSADLMELEVTSQGNRYVLAFIDQLTRYVQLIPLPSKDAETVADAFINQFVTVWATSFIANRQWPRI